MRIAAVVTAAGSGSRLGAEFPKALVPLAGRELVVWAVLRIADACDEVVVTAPTSHLAEFEDALRGLPALDGKRIRVISGGAERQQSVSAALDVLFAEGQPAPDVVLVHDAARGFQDPSVTRAAIAAVQDGADGAIPVVPVVDTLVESPSCAGTLGQSVDRDQLRAVQTPQVFAGAALRAAHLAHADASATDDAQLVRASGGRVVAVAGHEWGFKVTLPSDLPLAEHVAQVLLSAESQNALERQAP
ncbi:IspD/TarI family cytidylyltransferase [Demequina aurantiaca]|uniref:IspD/TarI family cytidylyltransferase n=1 Tax=Demequina aurantiaca TaxID=676200 RepID=UPI003D358C44